MSDDEFDGYIDADNIPDDDNEANGGDEESHSGFQQHTESSLDMSDKSPLEFFSLLSPAAC